MPDRPSDSRATTLSKKWWRADNDGAFGSSSQSSTAELLRGSPLAAASAQMVSMMSRVWLRRFEPRERVATSPSLRRARSLSR